METQPRLEPDEPADEVGAPSGRRLTPIGIRRLTLKALSYLVVLYVVVCAVAWRFQATLLYGPPQEVTPIEAALPGGREVAYDAADGVRLQGWYRPATTATPVATVVLFHGIHSTRDALSPLANDLARAGCNVFLAEYRGFAGSSGSPDEDGLTLDGIAAADAAARLAATGTPQLVLLGHSLGTGVAVRVAAARPPRALVLVAPFTSLPDAAAAIHPGLPYRWLMQDRFDNLAGVGGVASPTLVIAGTADEVVPFEQSREVFDAAARPASFLAMPGAHHVDPALFGAEPIRAILGLAAPR